MPSGVIRPQEEPRKTCPVIPDLGLSRAKAEWGLAIATQMAMHRVNGRMRYFMRHSLLLVMFLIKRSKQSKSCAYQLPVRAQGCQADRLDEGAGGSRERR